jgi:hypothetical protein
VNRILTTALFLMSLMVGIANAQPPVDYTLTCDGEVIGVVSYVDGQFHVAILEGVTCEGILSIAGDETLEVTLEWSDDGAIVTIAGEQVLAEEVPEQALAGMVTAQENRAEASENQTRGEEEAAAARERAPELPEAVESRPELPEAGGSRR